MNEQTQSATPSPPIDMRSLTATYANYMRASGAAEEVILDFGLDPHRPTGEYREPVVMLQRLVLTWGSARRLAAMLHDLLQHHDKAPAQK